MIELIRKTQKQYKANLHSHSTISDGSLTPQKMKELYRSQGYSILAVTDHNYPCAHNDLTEQDFLMLTGYEANIREKNYNHYTPEIHMCLYARDPKNRTLIWYEEDRMREGDPRRRWFVPPPRPWEYTAEYVNDFVKCAKENGYIVAHNHYAWSLEKEAQVLDYDGFFSMEICNGGAMLLGGLEYNAQIYDKMLRSGKRIACHGADDNHNAKDGAKWDSFLAYTYVLADELTYDAVFSALEKGNFYASRGPEIYSLTMEGRYAHVECSEAKAIFAYYGGKNAKRALAGDGEFLTSADFEIPEDAKYVRFSVFDMNRNTADTRGYFAEELGWENHTN